MNGTNLLTNLIYMTEKQTIRELARNIMAYADRKDYGLGECRWDLNRDALDTIEECDGYVRFDEPYDVVQADPQARCSGDHAKHLKLAKHLAGEAYELACTLQDQGVTTFN